MTESMEIGVQEAMLLLWWRENIDPRRLSAEERRLIVRLMEFVKPTLDKQEAAMNELAQMGEEFGE